MGNYKVTQFGRIIINYVIECCVVCGAEREGFEGRLVVKGLGLGLLIREVKIECI